MAIEVRWGSRTHAGRVRQLNQDAVLAGPNLFVVADGMGGHAAGDVASGVVVARMAEVNAVELLAPDAVIEGVRRANRDVRAVADADSAKAGMGSTVAGVAMLGDDGSNRILVFNIGDSRVYRWHTGDLTQVSIDHSVVAELLAAGALTEDEARRHPERHVVTRAVGIEDEIEIDRWEFGAQPGDRYLVCSDGLTDELTALDIADVTRRVATPQEAADRLLDEALDRGARDNVSVVVVEIVAVRDDQSTVDDDTTPRAAVDRPLDLGASSMADDGSVAPSAGAPVPSS